MITDDPRAEMLRQRYLADQVDTATPSQRLLMLQHRLAEDLRAADQAFESGSIEAIHRYLVNAQRILLALRDSLAGSDWVGAEPLRAVYWFVHQRLVECNLQKNRSLLPVCQELVGRILDANVRAASGTDEQALGENVA
ncbi:MAG: flagellar export chaperone FliS [Acidimicrobiales bacterium]